MKTLPKIIIYFLITITTAIAQPGTAVGDIKYSIIPPSKIETTLGPGWVLMDGRDLKDTDKLRQLTHMQRIPDARGMFLRGMNEGRSGDFADPTGNRQILDQPQSDQFKEHNHGGGNHSHKTSIANGAQSQWGGYIVRISETSANAGKFYEKDTDSGETIRLEGGKETRPKNIAVYIYVKIN